MTERKRKPHWEGKEYSFFRHEKCESFPCHATTDPENFNCLFCYCPLYALKDQCGGNFVYSPGGLKDCSNCLVPHKRENYGYIIGKFDEILEITKMPQEDSEGK